MSICLKNKVRNNIGKPVKIIDIISIAGLHSDSKGKFLNMFIDFGGGE